MRLAIFVPKIISTARGTEDSQLETGGHLIGLTDGDHQGRNTNLHIILALELVHTVSSLLIFATF
jgi:hypothetical protein